MDVLYGDAAPADTMRHWKKVLVMHVVAAMTRNRDLPGGAPGNDT
jgi:hypothetical protein